MSASFIKKVKFFTMWGMTREVERYIDLLVSECDADNIGDLRRYAESRLGRTSVAMGEVDALESVSRSTLPDEEVCKICEALRAECKATSGSADTTKFFAARKAVFGYDLMKEILDKIDNLEIFGDDVEKK